MDSQIQKKSWLWVALFALVWFFVSLYSYTQRDLNLTIFNTPFLQQIQNSLIELGYYQRPMATLLFLILSLLLIGLYCKIVLGKLTLNKSQLLAAIGLLVGLGLLAYPIFSHDIFNYLFNAKMVLVYGANPHTQTALDFASDPWVRFMHNVHTAAPYGYGWTAISLLPVWLGLPRFTISLFLMKAWVAGFYLLEVFLFYKLSLKLFPKKALFRTAIMVLNPLLLVETIIVGHNDSVMMAFTLLSLLILYSDSLPSIKRYPLALLAWLASVSIKYATVVLLPFYFLKQKIDIFTWGGLALLIVLLSRPGQLHSWYLHWGIVLLLLSKKWWAVALALLLSIGGLLRYAPFIYYGNWDAPVPLQRYIILGLPLLLLLFKPVQELFKKL
ncbi:hypothetical protein GYA49_05405 [Candidatus Beckwithbacteria bacterium]|nr:hypothetical protein [Candidatus Beckwithbacteria bacterium]